MADRILILGASARAAAASARRAGLTPFAVDLFADADTERICEKVWRCPPDRYPDGLFELAKLAPAMPWMYTGGLENYPELVGELARERELWGNGPEVLNRVRDPSRPIGWLLNATCRSPRVIAPTTVPPSGLWLRKPVRGSGGVGIRQAGPEDFGRANPDPAYYIQEWIEGEPLSALLVAESRRDGPPRRWPYTGFVALFRQLIGTPWLHAGPFQYAGNLGPLDREEYRTTPHLTVALQYANDLDLRVGGLWGVDLIRRGDDFFVVEVNPRYTAAVEVAEWSRGLKTLLTHSDCYTHPHATAKYKAWQTWPRRVGKAVYYAPLSITFPVSGPWDDSLAHAADVWHRPDYADLPHPGDAIEPGQPVLTILAEADTEADCLARLQSRAADLDRLFGYRPTPEDDPCPP